MSDQEVEDKARDLIAPVLGGEKCEKVLTLVKNLELVADVRELSAALAS
jgi:hypothetical protein